MGSIVKNNTYKSLIHNIKLSISGTDLDFTEITLGKAIFLLSVPMVLEMLMESVFAVVDIYFVSSLGAGAVAVVGLTESLMTIVYALSIGLSTATTAIVARRIGEKSAKSASTAAFQAILVGFSLSVVIGILGIFFAEEILLLMGAEPEIAVAYKSYTAIILGSNCVIMLLFIINAVFRSSGDAAISMRVLWLANLLNIFLDPMLIFGWGPFPELGITGAAIATTTGRGIAVIYQVILLFGGKRRIKMAVSDLKVQWQTMFTLIKLSMGGIGQTLIATSSWLGLVRIMAVFGSEALAGYTIAIRIILFILLPSWGLANAASTMVGQNLGAGKPARAEKAVYITGYLNMAFLGICSLAFLIFPRALIQIFILDENVVSIGALILRTLSIGFILYGLGMVMVQALNGAGDTYTPTLINFCCFWLFEIPLAYFLAINLGLEGYGVALAVVIAESIMTLVALMIFRRGRWKLRKI